MAEHLSRKQGVVGSIPPKGIFFSLFFIIFRSIFRSFNFAFKFQFYAVWVHATRKLTSLAQAGIHVLLERRDTRRHSAKNPNGKRRRNSPLNSTSTMATALLKVSTWIFLPFTFIRVNTTWQARCVAKS